MACNGPLAHVYTSTSVSILTLWREQAFKSNFPLDALVCNAATYQPATPVPRFTDDGFEESLQ
jgi:hypothetical protein